MDGMWCTYSSIWLYTIYYVTQLYTLRICTFFIKSQWTNTQSTLFVRRSIHLLRVTINFTCNVFVNAVLNLQHVFCGRNSSNVKLSRKHFCSLWNHSVCRGVCSYKDDIRHEWTFKSSSADSLEHERWRFTFQGAARILELDTCST